jgi:hypothetical protein
MDAGALPDEGVTENQLTPLAVDTAVENGTVVPDAAVTPMLTVCAAGAVPLVT